jgi:hypothetical protein
MAKNYVEIYKKVIKIQKQKVSSRDTSASKRFVDVPTLHSILNLPPKRPVPPTTRDLGSVTPNTMNENKLYNHSDI